MSMYVRIKRKNQTIFLLVEPTDLVNKVKAQVGEMVSQDPRDIKFYGPEKTRELPDGAVLSELEIKNDAIVFMVFKKEGDGWEDVTAAGGEMKG